MPVYKYQAISKKGEKEQGTYSATAKTDVIDMLRQNSLYPIKIDEVIESKQITGLSLGNSVGAKDIAVFCRQFYTLINAGITILNCLHILKFQIENKKLRTTIDQIYESVQKGLTLSESLKNHSDIFPELLTNMVEAGEISGNLDTILDRLANHYEKENKINNKVKSAMVYPIVLVVISTAVVIFLLSVVMPTFLGMFEGSGVPLPGPTRFLLGISYVIRNFWYLIILIIALIGFLFDKYYKSDEGRMFFDRLKLSFPIIKGANQKIITARFTRTLSTLISSGVPLMQSLDIIIRIVGNRVAADGLSKAKEEVRKGAGISEPIKDIGIFPPMVISMIKIGEESGTLDVILDKTANYFDEEVETTLQKMTTLIEPLMIVIMALMVGFIVLAMVLPMFDMINTVG